MKKEYTDKQRVEIAEEEYRAYKYGKPVKIDNQSICIGYVSQVNDDFETGGQSYVVTDKDVETAKADPRSVKEVTVLYQGSGNPIDEGWTTNNVKKDWIDNDIPLALQIGIDMALQNEKHTHVPGGIPTEQLKLSSKVLNQALKQYPNAKVTVYGHSLGSMDGQYALANVPFEDYDRVSGYLYEGPNIYHILNADQKQTSDVLTERGQIHNYVDVKDIIACGYLPWRHAVGEVHMVDSVWSGDPITQHMWGGYQFDEDGNVKCTSINLDKEVDAAETGIELQKEANEKISQWKTQLEKANGGSCTSGQEIFLDACQALSIVRSFQVSVQSQIEDLIKEENEWIREAEEHWNNTLKEVNKINQSMDPEGRLTQQEILEELASVGCTRESIVDEPKEKYETQKRKLQKVLDNIQSLSKKITSVIQKQVQSDQELARLFQ